MTTQPTPRPLTDEERSVYEWQTWVPGFGEEGQELLKGASVLISRVGGLGGVVAYELAAAGIGRLVLAHAGNVKPSDLNRQLLMTHDWLGKSRVESAKRRLLELNPRLEIVAVPENVTEENAARLVGEVDLVVDAAPLFEERFLLNREAIRQDKPMVECAMYELEAHITTIRQGLSLLSLSDESREVETRVSRLRRSVRRSRLYGRHGNNQGADDTRHTTLRRAANIRPGLDALQESQAHRKPGLPSVLTQSRLAGDAFLR